MHDPIVGRYTQSDVLGLYDGLNTYSIDGPKFGMLKDHARRHGLPGQSTNSYYNSAVQHTQTGHRFKFRHNGTTKVGYVTRTGSDSFTFTSTSRGGGRIFTHMNGLTQKELFRTTGIRALPRSF